MSDGEAIDASLTYAEVDARASAIGAALSGRVAPGERALLLYPPGLDFVAAFLGCLHAGVVAVPAYPPDPTRLARSVPRLRAIARDADVRCVLTTGLVRDLSAALGVEAPELDQALWIATDEVPPAAAPAPPLLRDGLAFLQYTSGSTGAPKGVMVTHGNLLHNLACAQRAEGADASCLSVSWLPTYHDMGLIEAVLLPLFVGYPAVLMPPGAFLERPLRWLAAISSLGATTSGGPNFGYDLCVRKVSAAERERLDLRAWRVAYDGAEPIRRATLESFCKTFAPCGFRRRAFYPVYGLAEATLLVSSRDHGADPTVRDVDLAALGHGVVKDAAEGAPRASLVSAGRACPGIEARVVNPATSTPCADDEVGEVWLRSASVAQGYWNKPEATEQVFGARLAGGDGPFLRTGDLGFLSSGELFVTGRSKDLIIVRGRKHYPQDLESTVEHAHPAIRAGCVAAVAVGPSWRERLVVAAEADPARAGVSAGEVAAAVRAAVADHHGVAIDALCLLQPRTLPKTSSGKLMRHACKEAFLTKALELLADAPPVETEEPPHETPEPGAGRGADAEEALAWLAGQVAARAGAVDVEAPLARQGLDSLSVVEVTAALARWIDRELPVATVLEQPTLRAVARLAADDSLEPS